MPVITERKEVLGIYEEAEKKGWVIPCLCTENLTTTEAILQAALEYGKDKSIPDIPVIVAITNQYDHRTQSAYYTHTRRWDIGLKLFMADLGVLMSSGSPYENLRVMVHLDHTQFDDDADLLSWDMKQFSSIMFDASKVPLDQNITLTKKFVEAQGSNIVIEGACDEIVDATGQDKSELTTAEKAEDFFRKTGVDLIVANLGTEHRASGADLKYYGDYARKIKEKIGTRIVLHGASSVHGEQIAHLIEDGVCKVNIWTALERDSSPVLLKLMVQNASKTGGSDMVGELIKEGYLTEKCRNGEKASIAFFTTEARQQIIFEEMKKIVRGYLDLWYV